MTAWLFAKRWRIIFAGVLIVAIPLLGLAAFVNLEITSALEDRLIKETGWFSVIGANNLEASLAGEINLGTTFVTRPLLVTAMVTGDKKGLSRHLKILVENNPFLDRAFITTPDAVQLANYPYTPETVGRDFSNRDWYRGVSRNWRPYVSEFYLRAAEPKRYLFAIAIPIRSASRIMGIMVMQPKADFLKDLLGTTEIGLGHLYVVDKNGVLVYHQAFAIDRRIEYTNVSVVRKVMSGLSGVDRIIDPVDKVFSFSAYHPVREWGWGVVVDKPVDIVLAPVRNITSWLVAVTLLLLALGSFAAYRAADLLSETQRLSGLLLRNEQIEKAANDMLSLMNRPWDTFTELCGAVLKKFKEHSRMDSGVLHLYGDVKLSSAVAVGAPIPAEYDGFAAECLERKKSLRMRSSAQEPSPLADQAGDPVIRDLVAIPLIYKGASIGALELGCIHGFPDKDIDLFEKIAPQLAIGLDNLRNHFMVKELSDERERANEELQDMNEKLQSMNQELQTRQRELAEVNTRLEGVSRTKSDFLANMSHELRTPMNSILGFSEILQDQLFGPLNDKQKEYVNNIHGSGRHLLGLINDVLDLSKVESGKMALELSQFPLRNALDESLIMLREKALKHNITMGLEKEPAADLTIEADARKFKQIMFNLLSNAVEFTPDGGSVRVKARLLADCGLRNADCSLPQPSLQGGEKNVQSGHRNSESAINGSCIEISVVDTGIGIRPEDLPKLFKEFTQLESAYTKYHEGTGLGLALTRRLVELHGGRIWVESEFGRGSAFTFAIPVQQKGRLTRGGGRGT